MKTKPAQFVILGLGAVAAVMALIWSFGGGGSVKLAHRVNLVDVKTGQLYEASTAKRAISEPAPAPDDGEARLLRVRLEENGKWVVPGRVIRAIKELPFNPEVIDEETGEVLTPSKDVRDYEVK